MDLKDVLYQMMQENTAAGQPTDLRVGTVTREEPLEITPEQYQALMQGLEIVSRHPIQ